MPFQQKHSHRRSKQFTASHPCEVQSLETRQLLSATGQFPKNLEQATSQLMNQEGRELTVSDGVISYGGEAIRLVGYGDYGILSEKDFNQEQFLDRAARNGVNLVRVWLQYQWTGEDGTSPFKRKDGQYQLNKLNNKYFKRLEGFLKRAEARGVIVQLTLFDVITLKDDRGVKRWGDSPFNTKNQTGRTFTLKNRGSEAERVSSFNTSQELRTEVFKPLIEKTVATTSSYGNVILEVMNEPEDVFNNVDNKDFHEWVVGQIRAADATVPISINTHGTNGLYKDFRNNPNVSIYAFHGRSNELDDIRELVTDTKLKKAVVISNDGDLTQLNPGRENQHPKFDPKKDDPFYSDAKDAAAEERLALLQEMMTATFNSGGNNSTVPYGHAHLEILDKGLNGNSWLSDDYELSVKQVDGGILRMLRGSRLVNHNPRAKPDKYRVAVGDTKELDVLAGRKQSGGDTDRDAEQENRLRIVSVTTDTRLGGKASIIERNGRQVISYSAPTQLREKRRIRDKLYYMISDGRGGRSVAAVTVTVRRERAASTRVNTSLSLITNDWEDGLDEGVLSLSQPHHGAVTLRENGTLQYTPETGFHGVDQFTYYAEDGSGGQIAVPVSVTVMPAFVDNGVLYVAGNQYGNKITITDGSALRVTVDGKAYSFDTSAIRSIHVAAGNGNDDVRNYTTLPMIAHGGAGDDKLIGGGGRDSLFGEDGLDQLFGGDDMDWLDGGTGNDKLFGGNGDDRLIGGAGDDAVYGQAGNDRLYGGQGNDHLNGHQGNDLIYGNTGNDHIRGGTGDDRIYGGSGNDAIYGEDGNDVLQGERGHDRLYGQNGNDAIYGQAGNDRLYGGYGDDHINGHQGHDFVDGSAGNDHIRGGSGNDKLYGGSGHDSVYGEDGDDRIFGQHGDDRLYGQNGDDAIDGQAGNDRIYGGAGHDSLKGGDGDDRVEGQAGNDHIRGDNGDDLLIGQAGHDQISGGKGNDRLYGGADNDTLDGDAGDDLLYGEAGNDVLRSRDKRSGNDRLFGGRGDDLFDAPKSERWR